MTTNELKEYIYENNKIEYVLENIGCHSIVYHDNKGYYSCGNYNGDNKSAIVVRNNIYINVTNYTRESYFKNNSDIFTLVQYNKSCGFREAVFYIHDLFGLEHSYEKKDKVKKKTPKELQREVLSIFTKHKTYSSKVDVNDLQFLDETILDDFVPILYVDWVKEGIMPWSAKKFSIAYSYRRKRIIIPLKYWQNGELLGTNARTTIEDYKILDIKKYIITPSYPKHANLYGLWENYDSIQKAGFVTVYEAEKSVLKRDSRMDSTGVALQGHSMSEEQARILIGLNVDVVIAMDKDVSIYEIWYMCDIIFRSGRTVYYIEDTLNILGEKDSPADADNLNYMKLFNNKTKYTLATQREYKKYLNS